MQTRRDQLHAYRFQNRRALAALVTGEPNAVEPPMRRLTVMTMSGVMIAVLVTVGFAVFGLIRPSAGDSWKEAGAIIVETETGATYVRLQGVLRQTVNYTSAVLAVGGNSPHVVDVERSDIADARRGTRIGIPGLPASLPGSGDLVGDPVSVCSREATSDGSDGQVSAKVSVVIGGDASSRRLGETTGVVVSGGADDQAYLLADGRRLPIASQSVANTLGIAKVNALPVGTAFINGVPLGGALKQPAIAGAGGPSAVRVDNTPTQIGRLLTNDGNTYVALADGLAQVTPLEAALLATLPTSSAGTTQKPLPVPKTTISGKSSSSWKAIEDAQFANLPETIPTPDSGAFRNGGVCAVYGSGSDRPRFAVPPARVSSGTGDNVRSSTGDAADTVDIPPGRAALIRSVDARSVFLVADPGKAFGVPNGDVQSALGYGGKKPIEVPAQVLRLIPQGPGLDPSAARRPANG